VAEESSTSFTPPAVTPAHKTFRKLQEIDIDTVTVIADFLSSILKVTKTSMEHTYKFNWVPSSLVEYVLTIPAMWSDSARDLMVQAAEKAGFGKHRKDFNLVSEPESAAAYTLKTMEHSNLSVSVASPRLFNALTSIQRGDTFIVCDAGGGTV
jgi:hypothetical protein